MHKEKFISKLKCTNFEIPISYLCIFIVTLFSVLTGDPLGYDTADGAAYTYYGIDLFQGIPNTYPSYLYQILAAIVSGGYFGDTPQITNIAYLSCIIFFFTNILLFEICRKKTNTIISLLFIIVLINWHLLEAYPQAAPRALTDPYGMFFLVLSSFFMLNGKYKLSGVAMAVAVLFRMQCLLFILLLPILSKKYRHACLPFLILFGITYILISVAFSLFFELPTTNSSFAFYSSMVANALDSSLISTATRGFIESFMDYLPSRLILLSLPIIFIFILFVKDKINKEILIFSFLITILTLICNGWFMSLVLLQQGYPRIWIEGRYFMYFLPYLSMSLFIIIYHFIKKDIFVKYKFLSKYFTVCNILLLLCLVYAFTIPSADTALKVFTTHRINKTDIIPLESIENPLVYNDDYSAYNFFRLFCGNEVTHSPASFDATSIQKCFEDTELPKTLFYLVRYSRYKNNSLEFIDSLKNNEEITYCNESYTKSAQVDSDNLEYYIFKRTVENK